MGGGVALHLAHQLTTQSVQAEIVEGGDTKHDSAMHLEEAAASSATNTSSPKTNEKDGAIKNPFNLPLERFAGVTLSAPAIEASLPPPPVVWFLQNLVVPMVPTVEMPAFLDGVNVNADVWVSKEVCGRMEKDVWGLPGALGWGRTMRFRTAGSLLQMTVDLQEKLKEINFPFFVAHDPFEKIILFSGSERLMAESQTAAEAKCLVRFENKKHDLVLNCGVQLTDKMARLCLDTAGRS